MNLRRYTFWRVFTGRHNSVEITNMVASHAKMKADQHFALFRRKYNLSDAETLHDLASLVSSSSLTQVAILIPTMNIEFHFTKFA